MKKDYFSLGIAIACFIFAALVAFQTIYHLVLGHLDAIQVIMMAGEGFFIYVLGVLSLHESNVLRK